jgi:hypothetical protein
MKIIKLDECGYDEAVLGFSLSYNSTVERSKELLQKYAFGKPGENKFLESIQVWLDVTAPRFWWQEADTYRLASKQSESTMHTLCKRKVTNDDFEYPLNDFYLCQVNLMIDLYRDKKITISELKNCLPEGFLQRRIWTMNYKCLQNIYNQRKTHRLVEWQIFIHKILEQIHHPEFLDVVYNKERFIIL